jgi:hypothetical protein
MFNTKNCVNGNVTNRCKNTRIMQSTFSIAEHRNRFKLKKNKPTCDFVVCMKQRQLAISTNNVPLKLSTQQRLYFYLIGVQMFLVFIHTRNVGGNGHILATLTKLTTSNISSRLFCAPRVVINGLAEHKHPILNHLLSPGCLYWSLNYIE